MGNTNKVRARKIYDWCLDNYFNDDLVLNQIIYNLHKLRLVNPVNNPISLGRVPVKPLEAVNQ